MKKYNKITEITQRSYDNYFNLWHLTKHPDSDNILGENNEIYIPKTWSIIGVYSNEAEAKAKEQEILNSSAFSGTATHTF